MKSTTTIKENYEFRRMYAKGKSGVSSCLVVYYRKNRLGHNRLGVTVSTKLGHAVVRNRVRRRIREIFPPQPGEDEAGLRHHRRRPHKGCVRITGSSSARV